MFVAPLVGRLANRCSRALGVPALIVMAPRCFWLAGAARGARLRSACCRARAARRRHGRDVPGGDDRLDGLDPRAGARARLGIVNMARQVGFAMGVAFLVAVFTGTIDDGVFFF